MKRLFYLFLLLISVQSFAQGVPPGFTRFFSNNGYSRIWAVDGGNITVKDTTSTPLGIGESRYRTADSTVYICKSLTGNKWQPIGKGNVNTLQQVLNAGSTLSGSNTIAGGNGSMLINGFLSWQAYSKLFNFSASNSFADSLASVALNNEGGTTWNAEIKTAHGSKSTSINSKNGIVKISTTDSILLDAVLGYRFTHINSSGDTTTYKPWGLDAAGKPIRMNYWGSGAGGIGQTITFSNVIKTGYFAGGYFPLTDTNAVKFRAGLVDGDMSVIADTSSTDSSWHSRLRLVNDNATPGNSKYYGTNSSGTKGFFDLPSGSGTVTTSATTLTLSTSSYYVFTGSSTTTWTLPASPSVNQIYHIKSRGSGDLTITAGSNQIFNTTLSTTYPILPGDAVTLAWDGTYWVTL